MIASFKEILARAFAGGYGIGAFNCLSLENVMGVVEAAERLHSPVILQLAEVQFPYSPLELMIPQMIAAAERSAVPVAVHLDHGQSLLTCQRAIELGVGSVMIDGAALPFDENVALTRQVAELAHSHGVDVEAELGRVGLAGADTADVYTDVNEAERFIQATGVDALAIAIGNLHGQYVATPHLCIPRVEEIKNRCQLPLVLHGGSGTSEDDFRACVAHGIAKVNVATALQVAATRRIQHYLTTAEKPNYIDIKWRIIEASAESAAYHMELFGSVGKA